MYYTFEDTVTLKKQNTLLGNADDPIESIQKYEEEFFRNSKLFRYKKKSFELSWSIYFLSKVMEYLKRHKQLHVI
jgi:hypothetical protein